PHPGADTGSQQLARLRLDLASYQRLLAPLREAGRLDRTTMPNYEDGRRARRLVSVNTVRASTAEAGGPASRSPAKDSGASSATRYAARAGGRSRTRGDACRSRRCPICPWVWSFSSTA